MAPSPSRTFPSSERSGEAAQLARRQVRSEQRKFNRNDETRVFKDWRDGQDSPVRWRAARFSTRLRAAGQLLELSFFFLKRGAIVLISDAPFVFHLVARVARQGIRAPYQRAFSCLPALASDTLAQMFGFNTHPLAIIGGMTAIFDISRRRTTEHNRIRQILSAINCSFFGPNTR